MWHILSLHLIKVRCSVAARIDWNFKFGLMKILCGPPVESHFSHEERGRAFEVAARSRNEARILYQSSGGGKVQQRGRKACVHRDSNFCGDLLHRIGIRSRGRRTCLAMATNRFITDNFRNRPPSEGEICNQYIESGKTILFCPFLHSPN